MIAFSTFSGEIPRMGERLLPPAAAVYAQNTRLERGDLSPMRMSRFDHTVDQFSETIYKFNGKWLNWPGVVNAAPAPVAEDRLYWTGEARPRVMIGNEVFDLRVPGPGGPLTATVSGTPDPQLSSVILYAYTFVTEFGEESEPSPLGTEVLWSPELTVTVEGFDPPVLGRKITKQRIYKSQTSALGTTQLFFIHERDATTANFIDVKGENPIQEPIQSTDFNPPPDKLEGLKAGPNGMMAAFVGKQLYFSEPYQPHAWPEKYILTTNYKIVGLAWFDNSLAVLTEGSPYVVQGITPETMAMERIKVNLPCLSARGIVDLGYSVAYPSTEGLVMVSASAAQVVTKNIYTQEQWLALVPKTIIAGTYAGKYIMAHTLPAASASMITILDTTGAEPFVSRATQNSQAMFNELGTGSLYVLRDGFDVYEWDCPSEPYEVQTWRSKPFVMPSHTVFAVCLIETATRSPGDQVKVTIRATNPDNGSSREQVITKTNTPVWLKAGFRGEVWQIEFVSTVPITAFRMANGIDELSGVSG